MTKPVRSSALFDMINYCVHGSLVKKVLFVRHAMNDFGYTYKIAENGRLAVEDWKRLKPSLILMDISMPELNGHEATQTIRDIEKAQGLSPTPIIAVTAHAMKEERQKCFDAGMDDYLSKPISVDKLRAKLETWLEPSENTQAEAV